MKRRPTIPQVYAYVTLDTDVVGYAVAMSHANVVVPMAVAAQPNVATNVAKRQLLRRRVLKDQLAASLKDQFAAF
jgi:hypothetical protein